MDNRYSNIALFIITLSITIILITSLAVLPPVLSETKHEQSTEIIESIEEPPANSTVIPYEQLSEDEKNKFRKLQEDFVRGYERSFVQSSIEPGSYIKLDGTYYMVDNPTETALGFNLPTLSVYIFSFFGLLTSGIFAGRSYVENKQHRNILITTVILTTLVLGLVVGFLPVTGKTLTAASETNDIQDPIEYEQLTENQRAEFLDLINTDSHIRVYSLDGIDQIRSNGEVYQLTRTTVQPGITQDMIVAIFVVGFFVISMFIGIKGRQSSG